VILQKSLRLLVILMLTAGMIAFAAADQLVYADDKPGSKESSQQWSEWWQQSFDRFRGCGEPDGDDVYPPDEEQPSDEEQPPSEDETPPSEDESDPHTPAMGSDGCGNREYPQSGTYTISVDGTERKYIVTLPDNYDPDKPYRLVFAWHGLGGTAEQISSYYYGLERLANNSAVFVAGQGLSSNEGGAGWPNKDGRDVAFTKAMYENLSSNYCIDEERVFSTGFSYGGIMSNTVGCEMGDVFRAIAPMSGSGPWNQQCIGQVAAWVSHGNTDDIMPFENGVKSRDHWILENNCGEQSTLTTPDPCVAYEHCDTGFPVHWCEYEGGHMLPDFSAEAIWQFFTQF
jgi:poly(3-hydroxybutyrate) depolymerase